MAKSFEIEAYRDACQEVINILHIRYPDDPFRGAIICLAVYTILSKWHGGLTDLAKIAEGAANVIMSFEKWEHDVKLQ